MALHTSPRQRPGQWIRSLRSKTGCIKRGGRLRRLPVVPSDAPSANRTVHGGAGVASASLYSQPFLCLNTSLAAFISPNMRKAGLERRDGSGILIPFNMFVLRILSFFNLLTDRTHASFIRTLNISRLLVRILPKPATICAIETLPSVHMCTIGTFFTGRSLLT